MTMQFNQLWSDSRADEIFQVFVSPPSITDSIQFLIRNWQLIHRVEELIGPQVLNGSGLAVEMNDKPLL